MSNYHRSRNPSSVSATLDRVEATYDDVHLSCKLPTYAADFGTSGGDLFPTLLRRSTRISAEGYGNYSRKNGRPEDIPSHRDKAADQKSCKSSRVL